MDVQVAPKTEKVPLTPAKISGAAKYPSRQPRIDAVSANCLIQRSRDAKRFNSTLQRLQMGRDALGSGATGRLTSNPRASGEWVTTGDHSPTWTRGQGTTRGSDSPVEGI